MELKMKKLKIKVQFKIVRKRVYHFHCLGCQNERVTIHRKNLREGLCRSCRSNKVDKNQMTLL